MKSWMTMALGLALSQTMISGLAAKDIAPVRAPGTSFRDCPHCPKMTVLPAGNFAMGSPDSEAGRFADEGPQHPVTIPRPFAMGVYDVTVSEYRRFVRATGRAAEGGCRIFDGVKTLVHQPDKNWRDPGFRQTDRNPVVCITWDDAHAYIDWLNGEVRKAKPAQKIVYRLPSEAEWEYAARAGSKTPFYWGDAIRRTDANYGPDEPRFAPVVLGADRWAYTSPVGSFPANAFGLFDMAGNAWNMTEDCWVKTYDGAPSDGSARKDGDCSIRLVRGGSWLKPPAGERSSKRGQGKLADINNHEIGFRVVRDLE